MRWRLKTEENSDEVLVELLEIRGDEYIFRVASELVHLKKPRFFKYSLQTDQLDLTFEAWSKDQWRAVQGSKVFNIRSISWDTSSQGMQNEIRTLMPGRVLKILARAGEQVKENQTLLIVEAMKMENEIRAPKDCKIEDICVQQGQSLESGALLIKLNLS